MSRDTIIKKPMWAKDSPVPTMVVSRSEWVRRDPFPEYRAVFCEECGDEALVYHHSFPVADMAGMKQKCECCGTDGKVVLLDDEGREWLEFRAEQRDDWAPLCRCGMCTSNDITCVSKD